jgi:hypothetical protein
MGVCLYYCLSYPAWKVHGPYYIVIFNLSDCTVFFHLSHKRHDFQENLKNLCFDFPYNFCLKCFSFLEEIQRCSHKFAQIFQCSNCYSCQVLMNLFPYRFSKNTQIPNFINLRPVEAELFHAGKWTDIRTDGWKDRHYESNSHSSQYFERV